MQTLLELNPAVAAAIIAAVVSLLTNLLAAPLRYWIDKRALRYRLRVEYEYEQRRQLRALIGRYVGRMVEAAENMNHRMWNLYVNETKQWLKVEHNYRDLGDYYYFKSSIYRFLAVCATARRFEAEALLLDSRIAEKSDLVFVRYVKALLWAMSDVALFKGLPYDDFDQVDHFFRDHLRRICDSCWKSENFVTLSEFEKGVERDRELQPVLDFFNGLQADEPRFRWDRLVALHLLLLAFLNTFGYESHRSTEQQFLTVAKKFRNVQVLANLSTNLLKLGLSRQPGAKSISSVHKKLVRQGPATT